MMPPEVTTALDLPRGGQVSIPLRRTSLLDAQWFLVALGVGVGSLVILLTVVPDIFVPDTSLGWVDAWYYVSLALKLPERVAQYHALYQSERIGWTLPAYVLNRVAPPLLANYLIKGTFFVGAVFFLFGAIKEITGSVRTAAFVSALAALHSFFVHPFGTSYVDGPMNAYILGNLYFSARAFSGNGRRGSAFAAGAFWGAQLLTHPVCVVLLPSVVLFCVLTWARRTHRRGDGGPILFALAAGVVAVVTGAFAVYAHWGVGTIPLRDSYASLFTNTAPAIVRPSSGAWLRDAFWLVLPTAATVWSLVAVGRVIGLGRPQSVVLRVSPAWWLLLCVSGCWVGLYMAGTPWLMLPFYSSYLVPFTFLALGRLAVTSVEMLSTTTYRYMLTGLFGLGALSYSVSKFVSSTSALTFALGLVAAGTVVRLRPKWHTSPVFPVLLIGVVLSVNGATADYDPQLWNGYARTAMAALYAPTIPDLLQSAPRADRFQAAITSADQLARRLSGNSGRPYFFWYDGRDGLGMFYRSVTSLLFAWSTSHLLGEDFNGFDERNRRTLSSYSDFGVRDLVILSRDPRVMPPDPRFSLQWIQPERVDGVAYFVRYFAFQPASVADVP